MPLAIGKDQGVILGHRQNFFGEPTGPNTVSWRYQGQPHMVKRPDDGQPVRRWQVRCGTCGKRLEFRVRSVRATQRRQARLRACAWAGLAVLIGGVVGCFAIGGTALPFLIGAAIVGALVGCYVGMFAADEMGISGHGAGMPIVAKHSVTLHESRPEDRPELVCDKCGHQEEYPWGSHFRQAWLDKQYRAAQERMDAHPCPESRVT